MLPRKWFWTLTATHSAPRTTQMVAGDLYELTVFRTDDRDYGMNVLVIHQTVIVPVTVNVSGLLDKFIGIRALIFSPHLVTAL
jgi:hypothetical protein